MPAFKVIILWSSFCPNNLGKIGPVPIHKVEGTAEALDCSCQLNEWEGRMCVLLVFKCSGMGLPWWLSGKESTCTQVRSLGWEDPLEKEMPLQYFWEIPWTEEPGRVQSVVLEELDAT